MRLIFGLLLVLMASAAQAEGFVWVPGRGWVPAPCCLHEGLPGAPPGGVPLFAGTPFGDELVDRGQMPPPGSPYQFYHNAPDAFLHPDWKLRSMPPYWAPPARSPIEYNAQRTAARAAWCQARPWAEICQQPPKLPQ